MNQKTSLVHCIEEGIFFKLPHITNYYVKETNLGPDFADKLESFIIYANEPFIKNEKGLNIHLLKAYKKQVKGFMVKHGALEMENLPFNDKFISNKSDTNTPDDSF